MKILEMGHVYKFDWLDGTIEDYKKAYSADEIVFVNREKGREHPGTQTQEVIRALIDRTKHCDNCLRWEGNDQIIYHLRMALVLHEARALERKTQKGIISPETVLLGSDGHFLLNGKEK